MKHFYHRGSIPTIQRINTLRRALARELGEDVEDCSEYLPLEELTHVRVRRNKRVAFSDSPDAVSSATADCHKQNITESCSEEVLEFPLEQHAVKIVDQMERDYSLMGDNPLSEQRRLDTLREMPESLTLKRSVRKKLVKRVTKNSRGSPLSLYKRLKYRLSMSASKFNLLVKDMLYRFELWYSSIKVIEGHYGSGVATYFRFFRWLFLMNCIVFVVSHSFVVIPQILYDNFGTMNCKLPRSNFSAVNGSDADSDIEEVPDSAVFLHEEYYAGYQIDTFQCIQANFSIGNIFTGEGFFTNTSLYYGHYSNESWEAIPGLYYSMPMAYFFTFLFCYLFIFISLSISMAKSYRTSFIETSRGVKNIYAHKIFCGWDYSIASKESAELKMKSVFNELRELLSEEDKSELSESWRMKFHIVGVRFSVHILTAIILLFTGGVMWFLLSANLGYDAETKYQSSMMMSLIVTVIMMISPVIFSWIVKFEEYQRPRTALYVTLVRTFLLGMVVISVLLAFWLRKSQSNTEECWETSLGQEVYRLVLMDFLIAIVGTSCAEFVRKRIYVTLWKKIGQPEFNIARNTLNLIYNETLFFVGFFFCPPVSLIIIIKMFITFYIKKIGALKNCQPSIYSWRAAQTQTIFLVLSFVSLLGVIIVYGYILMNVEASDCGPFRGYPSMYEMILEEIFQLKQDHDIIKAFVFITKPGVVAGILIGMCVVVYYFRAQSRAHILMVDMLQEMLLLEAKDKEFLLGNISKVTEGEWIYKTIKGHRVRYQPMQPSTSSTDLVHVHQSPSVSDEKVSEWLLKSAGGAASMPHTSNGEDQIRSRGNQSVTQHSSRSDNSVPVSDGRGDEFQESKDLKP